jgi:acyl-CoA reductase-like NAD-dependent aldehyde dehydrogenase
MKSASGDLKRISLELGGKNPFIILDKLNLKNAVKNLIISFTHNAGQCCVGVSKVYIEEKNLKVFIEEITSQLENQPKFTKQISNFKQYNKIYHFFKKNKFNKDNIIYGELPKKINKQNIFFPIIFKNLQKNHPLNNFEVFGPVLTVETFKDIEKIKNELNSSNYGLSCLIWAKKINLALDFTKNLKIGRVWINGNITQNYPQIPIGGFKWSGIGRETGIEGVFNYSEIRSVIVNRI